MTKSLDQKAEEYVENFNLDDPADVVCVDAFKAGYLTRDKEIQADLDKCKAALEFYAKEPVRLIDPLGGLHYNPNYNGEIAREALKQLQEVESEE